MALHVARALIVREAEQDELGGALHAQNRGQPSDVLRGTAVESLCPLRKRNVSDSRLAPRVIAESCAGRSAHESRVIGESRKVHEAGRRDQSLPLGRKGELDERPCQRMGGGRRRVEMSRRVRGNASLPTLNRVGKSAPAPLDTATALARPTKDIASETDRLWIGRHRGRELPLSVKRLAFAVSGCSPKTSALKVS